MAKNEKRNGMTFQEWLRRVDRILIRHVGLTHRDMEDFPSFYCWDDEMSPEEGARECLENDSVFSSALEDGLISL